MLLLTYSCANIVHCFEKNVDGYHLLVFSEGKKTLILLYGNSLMPFERKEIVLSLFLHDLFETFILDSISSYNK